MQHIEQFCFLRVGMPRLCCLYGFSRPCSFTQRARRIGGTLGELAALHGEGEAGLQRQAGQLRSLRGALRLHRRHEPRHLVVVLPQQPCIAGSTTCREAYI